MMRPRVTTLLFVVALVLASCAGNSVSDPLFGTDIAALQQKVDGFLAKLEIVAGTPDGEFARHAPFYTQLRDDIAALRNRAAGLPGNAAALADLDAISENLVQLEALHRQGVSPAELPVLRKLFGIQFALQQSITGQPPLAGKD
jgi:hypothetical protein